MTMVSEKPGDIEARHDLGGAGLRARQDPLDDAKQERQVNLGPLAQIPPGEGRNFRVGTLRIAVFRTRQGAVYATQAECPHRHGPLADGLVGGNTLVCPLHAWKFDLATGQTANGECGLVTYPTAVSANGEILVTLAEDSL